MTGMRKSIKTTRVLLLKKYTECVLKVWLQTVCKLLCVCPEDQVSDAFGFLKESNCMQCSLRMTPSIILDRNKNNSKSGKVQSEEQNPPVFLIIQGIEMLKLQRRNAELLFRQQFQEATTTLAWREQREVMVTGIQKHGGGPCRAESQNQERCCLAGWHRSLGNSEEDSEQELNIQERAPTLRGCR